MWLTSHHLEGGTTAQQRFALLWGHQQQQKPSTTHTYYSNSELTPTPGPGLIVNWAGGGSFRHLQVRATARCASHGGIYLGRHFR